MSWSVSVSGPRAEVMKALRDAQDNPYHCPHPEEGVKQHALGLAVAAVLSQPDVITNVSVNAYGSNYAAGLVPDSNQVTVEVRPLAP
jgi:hypothetical protein